MQSDLSVFRHCSLFCAQQLALLCPVSEGGQLAGACRSSEMFHQVVLLGLWNKYVYLRGKPNTR